jgi:Tol biopolymer transport system component
MGAQQQLWIVSAEGGEPRLLAEGRDPAISPDGKLVAYISKGQVWGLHLDDAKAKPAQLLQTRGSAGDLRWSPDGSRLAFVSGRGDHSFIAVYTEATGAVTYLDPSTDRDADPAWSPDSTRIVFLRSPPNRSSIPFEPHRSGFPWSIRIVDVATAKAHEIWHADDGPGSVFHATDSDDQLHWTAGDRIVFPWEHDGWLHLYAVPASGGTASALTPGDFEVEHLSLSDDRKTLVFDSNQNDRDPKDTDRRHIWRIVFAADGSNHALESLTTGEGIETQPVVASDGATIAVLRSDVRLPMRAAVVEAGSGRLTDLAP